MPVVSGRDRECAEVLIAWEEGEHSVWETVAQALQNMTHQP